MSAVSRFCHTNLVRAASTAFAVSSAESAHPAHWLRNPLLAKPWRSRLGWIILTGFNDTIDFTRAGTRVATIAAGVYPTADALSAAIVAAMEVADATPVWACTYSPSTFKFTISGGAATFVILWSTGANKSINCAPDLGFAYTDTGSATDHTSATAVYQSRHFVGFDFGSGMSPTAFLVRKHNGSASATFNVGKGNTSVLASAVTVAAGTGVATLAGTDPAVSFIAAGGANRRYWALVINDCGNSTGYAELGVVFFGDYVQPSITYNSEPRTIEDLSTESQGASGADFSVERAQRQAWDVTFHAATAADFALLEALRAATAGRNWFFGMDAVTNPTTTTRYGKVVGGSWHDEDLGAGQRDVTFTFAETLP